MVYLFPNTINVLSFQMIFVPNHFRVQLYILALNGWVGSVFTHQPIMNIINSWGYKNVKWHNHVAGRLLYYFSIKVLRSLYLGYLWIQLTSILTISSKTIFCVNFILSQYLYFGTKFTPTISTNMWSHDCRNFRGLYIVSCRNFPLPTYLKYEKILEPTVICFLRESNCL